MIDFEPFDVDIVEHRTVWFMDPAVDLEASDLAQWKETGKGYQIRPQQEPTIIRYHSLSPRERFEATSMAGMMKTADDEIPAVALAKYKWECSRFGLMSITGRNLARDEKNGVPCIAYGDLRILDNLEVPEDATGPLSLVAGTRLLTWLGGLVASSSFRNGS